MGRTRLNNRPAWFVSLALVNGCNAMLLMALGRQWFAILFAFWGGVCLERALLTSYRNATRDLIGHLNKQADNDRALLCQVILSKGK